MDTPSALLCDCTGRVAPAWRRAFPWHVSCSCSLLSSHEAGGRIGGTAIDSKRLDHFYTFGDVYETLDACDALGILLSRLKRQNILTESEWTQLTQGVANVRATVERKLSTAALTPKGPSLP